MMSDDRRDDDDDVFGRRVSHVLRTPERFDDDFEEALVHALRNDRPVERYPSPRLRGAAWWRTPMTVRVSPMVTVAMAASLVAAVSLAAVQLRSTAGPTRPLASESVAQQVLHDTVSVVRFVFVGDAETVSLVGDFNAWGGKPVALAANGRNDVWTVSLPLVPGRHEYAFIVDGHRWVADPFAPVSSDEFNTPSSIITVGT